MFGYQGPWCSFGWWWIFPIIMIVLCFFMMRGRMGSMMCRSSCRGKDSHNEDTPDPALDLLKKRYAQGEITKEDYEDRRSVITRHD